MSQTNAGKHAYSNIACEQARDTHNIQSSNWPKMSLCIMGFTLHEVMASVSIQPNFKSSSFYSGLLKDCLHQIQIII